MKSSKQLFVPLFLMAIIALYGFNDPKNNTEKWTAPAWTDTLKSPYPSNATAIKEGQKIYQSVCWSCHGTDGKGHGPASEVLEPKPADHTQHSIQQQTDGALYWKITTGRGSMQAYSSLLSNKQRWQLVHYIRTLKTTTP